MSKFPKGIEEILLPAFAKEDRFTFKFCPFCKNVIHPLKNRSRKQYSDACSCASPECKSKAIKTGMKRVVEDSRVGGKTIASEPLVPNNYVDPFGMRRTGK